jgi:hypothetical protein
VLKVRIGLEFIYIPTFGEQLPVLFVWLTFQNLEWLRHPRRCASSTLGPTFVTPTPVQAAMTT